jgi:hypothetical protein
MTLPHGTRPTEPAGVFLVLLGGMSVMLGGFLLMVWALNAEIAMMLGVAALLVGAAFLWWGDKRLYPRHRNGSLGTPAIATPESNKPDSWRGWRWVALAAPLPGVIINVMNPHHTPALRMASWALLGLIVISWGYALYSSDRARRRRRDASTGT